MKVFISVPMNGISDDDIKKNISNIEDIVRNVYSNLNIEIVNTFITDDPPISANKGMWYLAKSIGMLASADLLIVPNHWESYRGCKFERNIAIDYGVDCITMGELLHQQNILRGK